MSSAVPPSDLSPVSGPLLVGYILNWGLFGVLSMQVYLYYLAFPRDRPGHKYVVYATFLLELAQTILFTSSAFNTFATGFGNPEVLDKVDLLWFSMFIMSGIVAFISQSFYAYRVSILAQSMNLAVPIVVLALLQLGGSLAIGVQTKQAGLFSRFWSRETNISTGIWEGASTACDIMIAVSMLYYLIRRESKVKDPNIFITRFVNLTIESGALTAAIAIATVVLTFLPNRPTYYQASLCVLSKMYSNSMMVAFNSRMRIASVNSTTAHDGPIPLSYATGRATTNGNIHSRHTTGIVTTDDSSEIPFPPEAYKITDSQKLAPDSRSESEHPFDVTTKPE